jgi:hypothetical protein
MLLLHIEENNTRRCHLTTESFFILHSSKLRIGRISTSTDDLQ